MRRTVAKLVATAGLSAATLVGTAGVGHATSPIPAGTLSGFDGIVGSAEEVLGETTGAATEGGLPTDSLTNGGLPGLPVSGLPLG